MSFFESFLTSITSTLNEALDTRINYVTWVNLICDKVWCLRILLLLKISLLDRADQLLLPSVPSHRARLGEESASEEHPG
jgi:hypothetical protein